MVRIVDGEIVPDDAVPNRSRPNVAAISNNNNDSSNLATNQNQQYQYQNPNDGNTSNPVMGNMSSQLPSFLSSNPLRIALLFFALFFLFSMLIPSPSSTVTSKGVMLKNGTLVTPEEYYNFRNSQTYGFTGMMVGVFITAIFLGAYFYAQHVIESGRPFILPPGQLNSANPFDNAPVPGNFPQSNSNIRPTLPRGRGIRTLSDYSSGNNA